MMARATVQTAGSWETRLLAFVTVTLLAFGVIVVYSASSIVAVQEMRPGSFYAVRQLTGALVGLVALAIIAKVDYHVWARYAWVMLGVVAVLLAILLIPYADVITIERNKAVRWIGVAGIAFQPAELAKFAVVAWTAMLAVKKIEADRMSGFKTGMLPFVVVLAPIALMILLEPALSTSALVVLLAGIVLFTAGARIGHFILLGICLIPVLWVSISDTPYRLQRMIPFLSPGTELQTAGYQIRQSLIGIGSGGLFGVGFGQGMQKIGYLPFAYSDFAFSSIGEEWGFLGVLVFVGLYATFVIVGLRIARTARDTFGMLLATGVTAMIGLTAFFHIAVTLGVVPTTGLPLPFVSYGRSNLLVSMLATGVLINIGEQRSMERTR